MSPHRVSASTLYNQLSGREPNERPLPGDVPAQWPSRKRRSKKGQSKTASNISLNMIETSSPLAAMQPPAFLGHCGGAFRADAPTSYASFAAANSYGSVGFNFRDLSMKKVQPDYFSLKPVRGSSPTASLAADLSQNFHIDQRYAWVL